jgi:hypothetical protein
MDYKGKLYGKIDDRTYFPLLHTTDDWDNMVELLRELRDYMDNKADVDDGGYDEGGKFHHIANEEMRFRERIDEVLNSEINRKEPIISVDKLKSIIELLVENRPRFTPEFMAQRESEWEAQMNEQFKEAKGIKDLFDNTNNPES